MIRLKKSLLKAISIITLSSALLTAAPMNANAAWKQNSTGWWFTEGSSYATGWRQINGAWYFFDNNGYMKTGWLYNKGTWYYLDKSGAMKTGWVKDGSAWYFLNKSGAMKTGWVKDGSSWYFLNKNGAMKTGWVKDGSSWYYLDNSGAMQTGWIYDRDTDDYYFLDENGAMKTGWVQIDHKNKAYFKANGAQAIGWQQINGKTYYFFSKQGMLTSCIIDNYYIDETGVRQNKVLYDNADDVRDVIEKEDSVFINKIKSTLPDFRCSLNYNLLSSMEFAKYFEIQDEPVYNLRFISKSDELAVYNYFVGLYSGKIYIGQEALGRIYEIKDNAVVKAYDAKDLYNPSDLPDWR